MNYYKYFLIIQLLAQFVIKQKDPIFTKDTPKVGLDITSHVIVLYKRQQSDWQEIARQDFSQKIDQDFINTFQTMFEKQYGSLDVFLGTVIYDFL